MTSFQRFFLIDECLPPVLSDHIEPQIRICDHSARLTHFTAKFGKQGKWKDADFIPTIARDPRWVVLSGDMGKASNKFECMRELCRQWGVTLIMVGASVRDEGAAYYLPQVAVHWQAIMDAASGPRGGQYVIQFPGTTKNRTVFVALECPNGYKPVGGACSPNSETPVYDGEPESLSRGQVRKRKSSRKASAE